MNRIKAHTALAFANLAYGLNYVIAKGIMPDFMSPRGIIFLRVLAAMLIFNLIYLFVEKEKIERKDLFKIAIYSMFGVAINQILFFEGLNLTTPVNASLMISTGPISVVVFSLIILKERINLNRVTGIILGVAGACTLILMGGKFDFSSNTLIGNLLVFINISSYGYYLVRMKPLMKKYKPITLVRWVFNFGFLFVAPFCIGPALSTDFSVIPPEIWVSIVYVIIGPTILAYLLNIYALQHVSPVVNSSYIYTQPAIAAIVSYIVLNEQLTIVKITSAALIFLGVYFVSIRKEKRIAA